MSLGFLRWILKILLELENPARFRNRQSYHFILSDPDLYISRAFAKKAFSFSDPRSLNPDSQKLHVQLLFIYSEIQPAAQV